MSRQQVAVSASATAIAPNTLGTSSSGDMVIEIDPSKFKTFNQLKAAVMTALQQFQGMLPP